jgi:hypothetical protein
VIARIVVGLGLTYHEPCFLGRSVRSRRMLTLEEMAQRWIVVTLRGGACGVNAAVMVPR